MNNLSDVDILKRKLKREKDARLQAEKILEDKSEELYFVNKELKRVKENTEKELLSLFQNSAFGIALTKDGQIKNANNKFCSMIGFSLREVKKLRIEDVSFEDDIKKSIDNTAKLDENQIDSFTMEKRYKRKDGSLFWGLTRVSPVYNTDNEIKYHLAIIENIQDRKDAREKEELLIDELKRSNEELDAFAQMVSHDLKSPLKGISTLSEWLHTDYYDQLDDEGKQHILDIKSRVLKMHRLIDGIMSYTQINEGEKNEKIDLNELVDHISKFIHNPSQVIIQCQNNLPIIYADRHKMHQIFQNLLDNSVKYCDEQNGHVHIEHNQDKEFHIFHIKDNGLGIDNKYHDKIFKIFATLNPEQNSSGIGLAIVKKIIQQYEGQIYFENNTDNGVTFTFTLSKKLVDGHK